MASNKRRRRGQVAAGIGMVTGMAAAALSYQPAANAELTLPVVAKAILVDAGGVEFGSVLFTQEAGAVRVQVSASGLSEGWHGFHVHTKGDCSVGSPATPFTGAGGHLGSGAPLNQSHSSHDGDMPVLYANTDGVARATFRTDNFTMDQLLDADGSAVIVHAGADNLANIPTDPARYRKAPFEATDVGPDTATQATGDSGARQRCGLVQTGSPGVGGGYWMVGADGGVFALGSAPFLGSAATTALNQPVVGMAATASRRGYWLAAKDGGVFAYGDAAFAGSAGGTRLNEPVVGVTATKGQASTVLRDSTGVARGTVQFTQEGSKVRVDVLAEGLTDGWHGFHVHTVGNCAVGTPATPFTGAGGHLGSGAPLNQSHSGHDGDMPVLYSGGGVARATFRTDNFSVAQLLDADGSAAIVHAGADNLANIPTDPARYRKAPFGPTDVGPDAATLSTGDSGARQRCGTVQRTGGGYWLAASDGGVFAYGDAPFVGSLGALTLNKPVVGMAATPSGQGYWLVAADGGVFAFGDARYLGGTGGLPSPAIITGMASTSTGAGYWLVAANGSLLAFGDAAVKANSTFPVPTPPPGGVATPAPSSAVAITPTPTNDGYWMMSANGRVQAFGDAEPQGDVSGSALRQPVRGAATHSS